MKPRLAAFGSFRPFVCLSLAAAARPCTGGEAAALGQHSRPQDRMRTPRVALLLLLGGAAAAPMAKRHASPERVGSDAGPGVSALRPSSQGSTCDSSWCDCHNKFCDAQADEPAAPCNLCEQKWVFVLSAGGRSGSTSLLEGLNALPGVSLSGENLGLLSEMQRQFVRVDRLVSKNEAGNAAAFHLPEWRGQRRHTLCAQQSIMASLAGGNGSLEAAAMGGRDQIFGFKELIDLRSFEADAPFPGEFPHLEVSGMKREWVDFLETLFPCSRVVLNLRRDTAAQARAILSSFGTFANDPLGDATPPLTLIERDVEEASRFILELHKNKSATGRSFLVYTEDLTAERFSQLAQRLSWLRMARTLDGDGTPSATPGFPEGPGACLLTQWRSLFHSGDPAGAMSPLGALKLMVPLPQPTGGWTGRAPSAPRRRRTNPIRTPRSRTLATARLSRSRATQACCRHTCRRSCGSTLVQCRLPRQLTPLGPTKSW